MKQKTAKLSISLPGDQLAFIDTDLPVFLNLMPHQIPSRSEYFQKLIAERAAARSAKPAKERSKKAA